MVVHVVSGAGAVVPEQGRDGVMGSVGGRKGLIHLVPHHGPRRIVAVVATEAGDHAGDIGSRSRHAGGQHFDVFASVRGDGFAVQAGGILTPEGDIACGGFDGSGVSVAVRAAVRCVAGRATAAVVEVGAEDVGRRRPSRLRPSQSGACQHHQGACQQLQHRQRMAFHGIEPPCLSSFFIGRISLDLERRRRLAGQGTGLSAVLVR